MRRIVYGIRHISTHKRTRLAALIGALLVLAGHVPGRVSVLAQGGGCATPANGIVAESDVPRPAMLAICSCPPAASTRSLSPSSPDPRAKSAPPTPSSRILKHKFAPSTSQLTSTSVA